MGVHGLWQLLQPAGRPVSLESLEGKVLAVDVSIWLHQTMKGMRDKDGNPLPNAHLQGLFSRVCKLLFYRIKPIFVFDGGVPMLKKQTMALRRERKAEAERESSEIAQKLLQNLIKSQAVKQTIGNSGSGPSRIPGVLKGRNQQENDLFELAPLPESEEIGLTLNAQEWERDFELQENWIKEGLAALSDAHPDSEEFRSLPMEIQHEILNELREQKKYHSLSRLTKMPENSDDFSSYQLKKLMKQSRLTVRIEEVRKQMSNKTAVDVTNDLGEDYYGDEVEARRIVSEDASHYVLIKGLTKKKQEEEAEKYEIHNKVKVEKVEDDDYDEDNGSIQFSSGAGRVKQENKPEILSASKDQSVKTFSSDSDSDIETVMARRLRKKRGQKKRKSSHGTLETKGMREKEGRTLEKVKSASGDGNKKSLKETDESNAVKPSTVAESSSEDEGFIEVTVHPEASMVEDELFPASIFQTVVEPDDKIIAAFNEQNQKKSLNEGSSIKISGDRVIIAEEQKEEKLTRTLPQSALVSEDNAAKRKSVLSDILSQLQEKRKNLSESLMEIETSPAPAEKNNDPKSSPAQTDEDFSGMKTSPAKADKDLNGTKIPPAQSEEDFNTSGGFLREESLEEEEHDHEFAKDKKNRNSPTKNLIPQVIPRDKTSEDNNEKRPRSPESGRLGDAGCASDSDEDLKLAIELSLQTMPPQLGKDNKVGESKVMNLENDDEDDDFEEVETTSSELQSSRISAKQTSLQAVDEIVSIVDDSEKNLPRDGAVNDQPNVAKNGSEQGQEHQKVTVTNSEVAQGRLQPEDFETEDDVDPYFHTLNEDDLMDINSELESERSALLLQRGQQNRMATSVTEQTSLDAQELLRLFGIPFIVSPMEAESQCAYLDVTDQTQGTITDDSDIWLFGGRRMYKNFFNQSKHVEFFTKDSIHNQFGIGREQLINIALLCGSDYTEGIQGVGPVRAMEIMAEFPGEGLEGLYMFRKWWDKARKKNMSNPESKIRARLKDLKLIPGFPSEAVVDAYLKPTVDESTERFTWGSPDLDMLREFAKYKFGWSKEKTDQSLLPMMKQLNKKESQGRIHSYFQPENFVQASKIKSERLKKALEMVKNPKQAAEPMETSENEEDDADNENFEKDVEDGTRVKKAQKRKDRKEKEDGDSRPVKEAKLKKKAESEGRANKKIVKKGKSVAVGEKQTKGNEVVNLVESQSITCSENWKPVERDEDDHVKSGLEEDAEVKVEDTMSKVQGLCMEEMEEQFMQDMAEKVIHAKAKLEEIKGRGRGRGRGVKRGQDSVGGRGKVLSLDQRPKSRKGQSARLKKVGSQKRGGGRGVVNLSESSSDSSDTEHDKNGSSGAVQTTQVIPEKQFVKNSQGVKEKLYRTKLDVPKTVRNTVSESKAMESDAPLGTGKQTKVNIVSSFRDSSADTKAATRKKTVKNTSSSCVKGNSSGKTAACGGELNETAIPKSPQGTSGNTKTSAGSAIKIRPASGIKLDAGPESSSNLKGIGLKPPRNEKAAEPVAKASVYKSSQDSAEVADNKASARSVEMRQSGQDSSASRVENAEQEGDAEIDIRKADVSIINKQNLPATLTYLNRRSREDTFLLHQLKGSKAKNSVEQRLEESEKRSRYERSRSERQETPNSTISAASEEILSFEEMLGGMDDVVTQKVQKKTKKPQTKKSSDMNSLPGKDKLSKAKAIQEKIAKEVGHFRAAVVGDSEKMGFGQKSKVLNTDLAYQSEKGKSDVHESGLQGNVRKFNEENQMHKGVSKEMKSTKQKQKEEKVGFGSSDESMDWFDSPPSIAKSSQPDKETVSFKSHRSAAFDKPIGGDDDFDDDVVNDGNSRKYGKRNKFDKQLEHFADSKSVKGLGYLSSEMNVGRPQRGRAFAGKGKGRGKNRNRGFEEYHNTGVPHARPDVYASREVTLDEIAEYANVNADDLGSDFSDLET